VHALPATCIEKTEISRNCKKAFSRFSKIVENKRKINVIFRNFESLVMRPLRKVWKILKNSFWEGFERFWRGFGEVWKSIKSIKKYDFGSHRKM